MAPGDISVIAAASATAADIDTAMTAAIVATSAAALITTAVINNVVFCIAKEV